MNDFIFIVDDNADDLGLLKDAFHANGFYNVKTFLDPFLLIKHLYTLQSFDMPCLIVTDYNMPVLDGFNVVCFINTKPRYDAVQLAVITGSILAGDVDRLVRAGVHKILLKPVTFDEYRILAAELAEYTVPCQNEVQPM